MLSFFGKYRICGGAFVTNRQKKNRRTEFFNSPPDSADYLDYDYPDDPDDDERNPRELRYGGNDPYYEPYGRTGHTSLSLEELPLARIFYILLAILITLVIGFSVILTAREYWSRNSVETVSADVTVATGVTATATTSIGESGSDVSAASGETTNGTAETTEDTMGENLLAAMSEEERYACYANNLVVMGDSIASGYHLYGYIPTEHGLATSNAAIRNLHDYTYSYNGTEDMDVIDIIAAMQPAYILMSMGMNDINMISSETYTETYHTEIEQLLVVSPNTNIVVASITPVEYDETFTTVTALNEYNSALEEMVESLGLENVVFFDAFSVLEDSSNHSLKSEYSAGDGIHLAPAAYEAMLDALYPILDTMTVSAENLILDDETDDTAETTTADTTTDTETYDTYGTTDTTTQQVY